jgi:hypothetical protein
VISQIKETENVFFKNRKIQAKKYFVSYSCVEQELRIHGGKKTKVTVGSARLNGCSQNRKRFVIALKYEGEKAYRYIVATQLSWGTLDIMESYSLRWLIESYFNTGRPMKSGTG